MGPDSRRAASSLSSARFTGRPIIEPLSAADLPLLPDERVYHLQLHPSELSPYILLVGDPERVPKIADAFLTHREIDIEHRGLRTITGSVEGLRVSIVTSGMGTPSEEIVLQELQILNEIDPKTRSRRESFPPLSIIRVGTSGGLQESTALGTPLITSYAIGMDNSGVFYDAPYPDEVCQRIEKALALHIDSMMAPGSRFRGALRPYVSRASPEVVAALIESARDLGIQAKVGFTVSNSGFFAAQGRHIARIPPSLPDLDKILGDFDPAHLGQHIENMEMEASFLCHFGAGLQYRIGAICPAIANRRADTFKTDYEVDVSAASRIALGALAKLARMSENQ